MIFEPGTRRRAKNWTARWGGSRCAPVRRFARRRSFARSTFRRPRRRGVRGSGERRAAQDPCASRLLCQRCHVAVGIAGVRAFGDAALERRLDDDAAASRLPHPTRAADRLPNARDALLRRAGRAADHRLDVSHAAIIWRSVWACSASSAALHYGELDALVQRSAGACARTCASSRPARGKSALRRSAAAQTSATAVCSSVERPPGWSTRRTARASSKRR